MVVLEAATEQDTRTLAVMLKATAETMSSSCSLAPHKDGTHLRREVEHHVSPLLLVGICFTDVA
eukprot:1161392-Pelagomonas_calceolata.AAC.15